MPIAHASNINVEGLNEKESRMLIIKIAHQQKWHWFYDKDNLCIELGDSLKAEYNKDEERMDPNT